MVTGSEAGKAGCSSGDSGRAAQEPLNTETSREQTGRAGHAHAQAHRTHVPGSWEVAAPGCRSQAVCALVGVLCHLGWQPGAVAGRVSCHHRSLRWADGTTGALPQEIGLPPRESALRRKATVSDAQ